ncbi:MAG TPA: hypothetical protein VFR31_18870 [Thermoanaerobaculia bacterium]|nr:hypothetical protein [Thermoanaerobaculia bacterium]
MLQILRVNVAGHGYTLYSVDAGRVEFLGGETPPTAEGFEAIANRLDDFLERHGGSSMSFRRSARGQLTFGYACRLDASDEYGRRGLTFLHTMIFDDPALLPSCALTALASLSGPGIDDLTQVAEKLARGAQQPAELLPVLARSFEEGRRFDPSELKPADPPAGTIVHDCGGAAALAWSTLAMQQAHANPPWEVFDTGSASGGTMTRVEPSRGREVRASELLMAKARQPAPPQVSAQKPEAPRPAPPSTLVSVPQSHGGTQGASGRSIQRLLLAAGLVILIALLWTRSAMEQTRMRLEQERADLVRLFRQVKDIAREQQEHVARLVQKEVESRIEEFELQRAEEEIERAGFLQVPVLHTKPHERDCVGGEHRGRMSLLGNGSDTEIYVCGPKGWLVFKPVATPLAPRLSREAPSRKRGQSGQ